MKFLITYFDPEVTKMFVTKTNEKGENVISVASVNNFVSRDEIIARAVEADSEENARRYLDPGHSYYAIIPFEKLRMDSTVYSDSSTRSYKAHWYGFVVIDQAKNLRVISPLQINKNKTEARFIIVPTKTGVIPSPHDIEEELLVNKITELVPLKQIEAELAKINSLERRMTRILVAAGRNAVDGRAEYYEPLIELDKKAGKLQLNGSIDFKEIDSIHEVKKGHELLKRHSKLQAVDGKTIYGEKIPAQMLPQQGYLKGDNIGPSPSQSDIFVASLDGCLTVVGKKISVSAVAYFPGDINYETGNVHFHGTVNIRGSVLPGFEVRAGSDIVIEGNVDDAIIDAGGTVTVKMGIAGKGDTKVSARGDVTAKYIVNSRVESEANITAEESIINSEIFSNNRVVVSSEKGKIMGGKVTARYRIEVQSVGSNKETITELTVGRNLKIERVLEEIRRDIAAEKTIEQELLNKMQNLFGKSLFENPKEYVSILPPVKKKQCVAMLGELSVQKKKIAELVEKEHAVEEKLVLEEEPLIIVRNTAFPGTVITIRKSVRRLEESIPNAQFYEDQSDKMVRFTAPQ